jgi:isopentenyl diphosphate isomerase/L-lactate dehydrogenase-like FMN-dependent dehydrogenase
MRGGAMSIGRYLAEMLDHSTNRDDVAEMVRNWDGQFCLKGIMSVEDANHAAPGVCAIIQGQDNDIPDFFREFSKNRVCLNV